MGSRAGLDWRKISSPPGFDPGPSSPQSVVIPTELPGPLNQKGPRETKGPYRNLQLAYGTFEIYECRQLAADNTNSFDILLDDVRN